MLPVLSGRKYRFTATGSLTLCFLNLPSLHRLLKYSAYRSPEIVIGVDKVLVVIDSVVKETDSWACLEPFELVLRKAVRYC